MAKVSHLASQERKKGHLALSVHIFMPKELGTHCSGDFACATAGELSSAITNVFGRLTT